jgi:hypothetical protein
LRPIDLVAERLADRLVNRRDDKLIARCPAHDDRKASLSVGIGADDRALVYCHAGCGLPDALEPLGLEPRDLFAGDVKPWTNDGLRRTDAALERDGRWRLGAVRYLPGTSGPIKTLAAKGSKRGLYPDPASVGGETLYVVEGEPDAVTGASLGLPTIAIPGAGKWRDEWATRIAEGRRRVVVIPDADEAGRRAAKRAAGAIASHCEDVRILDLFPDRADGADLSDFAAGAEREPARERLIAASEDAPRISAAARSGAGGGTLRILDVGRMVATPPPRVEWRVEGFAIDGCLTLLSGREGQGKSLLDHALAGGVVNGEAVAGLRCKRGRVLIVDAENGEWEIHRRVHTLGLPRDGIIVMEAVGFHLGRHFDELAHLIHEHKPAFLVLDSFRSLWPGGDENDTATVAAVLDPLRNLTRAERVATVLNHHLPKAGGNYRGSTAIGACVELGFKLSRVDHDPERGSRRRLDCFKCRPAAEPDTRWLRLHVERGLVFVEQAEPFESDEEGEPKAPARAALAPRIVAAAAEPMPWPDLARAIGRDPKDGTARRLRADLVKSGDLRQLEDRRYVACDGATGANGADGSSTVAPGIDSRGCQGANAPRPGTVAPGTFAANGNGRAPVSRPPWLDSPTLLDEERAGLAAAHELVLAGEAEWIGEPVADAAKAPGAPLATPDEEAKAARLLGPAPYHDAEAS